MNSRFDNRVRQLLPILQCPVSASPLSLVDSTELVQILAGTDSDGIENVTGALIAADTGWTYFIRGQIVDLRPEKAVSTDASVATQVQSGASEEVKNEVKSWYDSFGWQRNAEGLLNDTAVFSQNDSTDHGSYEMSSHLALADRFQGGRFLLDAASGAIAHPEYLAYSYFHDFRVCVDFSETALIEASNRIGERGFCVLADICQLPFAEGSFEGVISGYTVQHIHQDQQQRATEELYRVLKPGSHLCLMTGINVGRSHRVALKLAGLWSRCRRMLGSRKNAPEQKTSVAPDAPPHQLYCHYWNFTWWRKLARGLSPLATFHCLRLFSKVEFNTIVQSRSGVRRLRGLETIFSQLLARASYFIVVDVAKPDSQD